MLFKNGLIVLSLVVLSACSSSSSNREIVGNVEFLYNKGMDNLEEGLYGEAINTFEELERQHPYSGWATRAQMMTVYALYRRESFDEAVVSADRFISSHPGHRDIPYMIYLKGMSHYNRISDVRRDQHFTEEALKTFTELTRRYPESEYSRDARLKITLCMDHLAGKEMLVGRYYLNQKRYMAAINRFRAVVEAYELTSQVPEALYRLTEAYVAIGIDEEAQQAAAVLGHNFPDSQWYVMAYDLMGKRNLKIPEEVDERSWFGKVVHGLKRTVVEHNN